MRCALSTAPAPGCTCAIVLAPTLEDLHRRHSSRRAAPALRKLCTHRAMSFPLALLHFARPTASVLSCPSPSRVPCAVHCLLHDVHGPCTRPTEPISLSPMTSLPTADRRWLTCVLCVSASPHSPNHSRFRQLRTHPRKRLSCATPLHLAHTLGSVVLRFVNPCIHYCFHASCSTT